MSACLFAVKREIEVVRLTMYKRCNCIRNAIFVPLFTVRCPHTHAYTRTDAGYSLSAKLTTDTDTGSEGYHRAHWGLSHIESSVLHAGYGLVVMLLLVMIVQPFSPELMTVHDDDILVQHI